MKASVRTKSSRKAHQETELYFHLCTQCGRTVPARSGERYCPNDGTQLLEACPACETKISNPYARHCTNCGHGFARDAAVRKPG